MVRFHATAEGNVPFTAAEEAEADAAAALFIAAAPRRAALENIAALEAQVTPRRVREAIRGNGKAWLDGIDDQIAALRTQII